jgi:hypothetical protein
MAKKMEVTMTQQCNTSHRAELPTEVPLGTMFLIGYVLEDISQGSTGQFFLICKLGLLGTSAYYTCPG